MANIYWVGGTGTWNTSSTTNWANSSGGTGGTGTVPTAADNVFFDQAGTYTVTLTGALTCLDITVSGGTVTFSSTGTLAVSGSMSVKSGTVWSATGTITFNATSSKTITTNGTSFSASMTFNGVGGSWQLQDALTIGATNTITLTNGTLDLNSKNLTCGLFSSTNTNTRTLAFGTGQMYVTGNAATVFNTATDTNLTVTGTPNVNFTYSGATGTRTLSSNSISSTYVFNLNITAGTDSITFGQRCLNLDFTGFSGTLNNNTRIVYGNLTFSAGMTLVAGTLVTQIFWASGVSPSTQLITTNGQTLDFPMTFNGVGGTFQLQDAMTVGSTRTVTLTNGTLDLNNKNLTCGIFGSSSSNTRTLAFGTGQIYLTGSAAAILGIGTTTNLTITGTPIINATYSGSTGTRTINLSLISSGNQPSINVTAGSDIFSFNSVVTNVDFTGFNGTFSYITFSITGNLKFVSGMTLPSTATAMLFFGTSRTQQITSAGLTLDFPITFNGVGGTFQLQDAMTVGSTRTVTLTNGTQVPITTSGHRLHLDTCRKIPAS
jgi:hypothetical protein